MKSGGSSRHQLWVGASAVLVLLSCTLPSLHGAAQSLPCSPSQGVWLALPQRLGMVVSHCSSRASQGSDSPAWPHLSFLKVLKVSGRGFIPSCCWEVPWEQLLLSSSHSWQPEGRGHCQFSLFHMNLFPLWSLATGSIH